MSGADWRQARFSDRVGRGAVGEGLPLPFMSLAAAELLAALLGVGLALAWAILWRLGATLASERAAA